MIYLAIILAFLAGWGAHAAHIAGIKGATRTISWTEERAKFEDAARINGLKLERCKSAPGTYLSYATQRAWEVHWKTAVEEAFK